MKTPPSPRPPSDGSETRSLLPHVEPAPEDVSDRTQDAVRETPPAEAPVPARIGRYLVIDRLGQGGMGVVFEAFDPELDRRVALKLLRPERSQGTSRLRLLREAQAMARLSHPNVVQVYDVGVDGEQVFVAMELVRGCTLARWLEQQPRPWAEIVARFVDAGRGLQAAHDAGLIHRDFKPHNVLLGDDGRVRVADFGLAGARDDAARAIPSEAPSTAGYLGASLTATGTVLGTPRYMAPEQHVGLLVGPAVDQFALCVALFEAVFGQHPFGGDSAPRLITNVVEGRYQEPDDPSVVPKWLLAAIRRGLARDPAGRYASVEQLLHTLEREPARRRRRRIARGGALAAGLGISLASWLSMRGQQPCAGSEAAMAEVWSETQRDALSAAMGDASRAEVVTRTLDDYADAWVDAHQAVCLEHHDAALSTTIFDKAMGCLQRGRAALDGVADTVATGEPEVVAAAAGAAAGLPALSHCRDRERLLLDIEPPADPTQATAVAGLRERLARAEAVHDAGALQPALEELAAIEHESAALHYAPLLAERGLVAGRLAMDRMDWALAGNELTEAMTRGLASGVDRVAAEAAARLVFVEVMHAGPDAHEPRDEAVAEALVRRVGEPPELAALLANNLGVVRVMSGNREGAREAFSRALAQADAASGVDPVDHCGYVINLALGTTEEAQRDALFERAGQLALRSLGPEHERTLELAMLRAQYTVQPAASEERLEPVCEQWRERLPVEWPRCHTCYFRLAELRDLQGSVGPAQAALAQAERCLAAAGSLPEGSAEALEVEVQQAMTRGYAAVLRGDHSDALARLGVAQARLGEHEPRPWIALEQANAAVLRARSLQALGRGSEAIPSLRQALTTYEDELRRSEDPAPRQQRARVVGLLSQRGAQRWRSMPKASSQR